MKTSIPLSHRRPPWRPARGYRSRLNREASPLSMRAIPILSVMLGSIITTLPFIETQAILPPFGLLIFLAWRLLRPGFWPMWAGLPFGIFDDMFSGAPLGSAALIWSLIMITIELIDTRAVWRDHWQDWFIAAWAIALALLAAWFVTGLVGNKPGVATLLPQIIISIFVYPPIVRLTARLDSWRLAT